jgi:uncharacterized membrane protein (DUF106 family)
VTLNDWKRLEITQVIMAEFKHRQELLKEELADQAGLDPLADRQKVGAIKAYQDFLDIEEESL